MERNSILSIFLCNKLSQTIHIYLLAEFIWVRMSGVAWLGLTGSGLSGVEGLLARQLTDMAGALALADGGRPQFLSTGALPRLPKCPPDGMSPACRVQDREPGRSQSF